jgi:hypothetical protein
MVSPRIRRLFDGLLIAGIFFALAILLLEWWHQAEHPQLRQYLAVGGGIVVLALASLYLLPSLVRVNMTLSLALIALCLWGTSLLLYEWERPEFEERLAAAREAGIDFDARTRREVLRDLHASGVEVYPPLSAWVLFEHGDEDRPEGLNTDDPPILPLAGVSNATTMLCNERGEYLILESDRFGFNNPEEVHEASSPALLLGDSFAFGYCVPPEHNLAGQLRSAEHEVVNLGYPGTGPLIQLAQLREYGELVQPSVILWLFFDGNDISNLVDESAFPPLRRYLDRDYRQGLPERQEEIDAYWVEHVDLAIIRDSGRGQPQPFVDILRLKPLRDRVNFALVANPVDETLWEFYESVTDLVVDEADRLEAPLYFVYLPKYEQLGSDGEGRLTYRDETFEIMRERDIPIIDFEARLEATGDPHRYFPFRQRGHYTEEGYALLAQQLMDEVPELRDHARDGEIPHEPGDANESH